MDIEPIGYTLENHSENLLAKINVYAARLTISNREDSRVSRWKVDGLEIEIWFDCHKHLTTNLKELEEIAEDELFTVTLY